MLIEKLQQIFNIEIKDELKEILSLCQEDSIRIEDSKILLSIDLVLDYKKEMQVTKNIIPIIDLFDNDYLVYDIENKKFTHFNIVDESSYCKIDLKEIKEYIKKIRKVLSEK